MEKHRTGASPQLVGQGIHVTLQQLLPTQFFHRIVLQVLSLVLPGSSMRLFCGQQGLHLDLYTAGATSIFKESPSHFVASPEAISDCRHAILLHFSMRQLRAYPKNMGFLCRFCRYLRPLLCCFCLLNISILIPAATHTANENKT